MLKNRITNTSRNIGDTITKTSPTLSLFVKEYLMIIEMASNRAWLNDAFKGFREILFTIFINMNK